MERAAQVLSLPISLKILHGFQKEFAALLLPSKHDLAQLLESSVNELSLYLSGLPNNFMF